MLPSAIRNLVERVTGASEYPIPHHTYREINEEINEEILLNRDGQSLK